MTEEKDKNTSCITTEKRTLSLNGQTLDSDYIQVKGKNLEEVKKIYDKLKDNKK